MFERLFLDMGDVFSRMEFQEEEFMKTMDCTLQMHEGEIQGSRSDVDD